MAITPLIVKLTICQFCNPPETGGHFLSSSTMIQLKYNSSSMTVLILKLSYFIVRLTSDLIDMHILISATKH